MPTRAYYAQRTAACTELLRLQAEGVDIDPRAIEWAESMRPRKTGRKPEHRHCVVLEMLSSCGPMGLQTRHVMDRLGCKHGPISTLLGRMVARGEAWSVKAGTFVHWFPTEQAAANAREVLEAEALRKQQEYQERERTRLRTLKQAKQAKKQAKKQQVKKQQQAKQVIRKEKPPKVEAAGPVLMAPTSKPDYSFYSAAKLPKAPTKPPQVKGLETVPVQVCRPCQVERFKVTEPPTDGFYAEWQALRAGGASA